MSGYVFENEDKLFRTFESVERPHDVRVVELAEDLILGLDAFYEVVLAPDFSLLQGDVGLPVHVEGLEHVARPALSNHFDDVEAVLHERDVFEGIA